MDWSCLNYGGGSIKLKSEHMQQGKEVGITIGIDASRNRSGGGKAHVLGILKDCDPLAYGIQEVHVWSFKSLLEALPDAPWLVKHNPIELERSLIHQVWWQYRSLPKEARNYGCQILLNTDAATVCPFRPAVVMSRDMLSYEPGEMERFGLSKARLRLLLIRFTQSKSMKNADGVVFLTKYAAKVIQKATGPLLRYTVIPHGVGENFRNPSSRKSWPVDRGRTIRFLYVSDASMYKHQWNVVKAVGQIRQKGFGISLLLVGGGKGRAQRLLDHAISITDPKGVFVEQKPFVDHNRIPDCLADADAFVFASSCENMPNTLVEAMASGLPIASSNRGPMPEVLQDGGVYFDPEQPESISSAIEEIITKPDLREKIMNRAKELAGQYSWARCSAETWTFLRDCATRDQQQNVDNAR